MSFSSSVLQFFFGFLCIYFINVRFKMIKNYVLVFVNDSPSFVNIFAVKFFRLVYVALNAAARNVIVDSLDDVSKNSIQMPSLSIDSENDKRMSSTSMVRRRVRKIAECGRFWSISRFGSFSLGSMMILAIVVVSWVFAVGECNNDPSRYRREAMSDPEVRRVEFFDAYNVRRGAATMGGSIEITISNCDSGESYKLLTEDRKERGEGTCGRNGRANFKINITDDMPIGNFMVKKNETISSAFPSFIHYVLVNRPLNVKECNAQHVYAKIAGETTCTTLDQTWCSQHYERSSKVGCPAADDKDWKSWCYGVGVTTKMPTSETDKTVHGCQRNTPPYVVSNTDQIPNDGWINMTANGSITLYSLAAEFKYVIDRFDGNPPIGDNGTGRVTDIALPPNFFNEPFKATIEINVTVNNQKFCIRQDLYYVETNMTVNISATCNMKSSKCKYEATGELAEFCKQRMPTMVCGMKFDEQFHTGLVVPNIQMTGGVPPNTVFFYGWYPWDGQKFIHGITAEMTPNMIVEIKTTTTGDGGGSTGGGGGGGGGSGSTPSRSDSISSTRATTVDVKQTKSSGGLQGKSKWMIVLIVCIGAIIFGNRYT